MLPARPTRRTASSTIPAPTLFTFASEPTACEILFLRQSEMRLAVNWVYDGIKYACRRPHLASPRLDASRLPSRFIGFINSEFALLFSTSSTSKRTYWSVFEWNIISHSRRFMHPVYIPDVIRSCFSSRYITFSNERTFQLKTIWASPPGESEKSSPIDAIGVFIPTFSIFWGINISSNWTLGSIWNFIKGGFVKNDKNQVIHCHKHSFFYKHVSNCIVTVLI